MDCVPLTWTGQRRSDGLQELQEMMVSRIYAMLLESWENPT